MHASKRSVEVKVDNMGDLVGMFWAVLKENAFAIANTMSLWHIEYANQALLTKWHATHTGHVGGVSQYRGAQIIDEDCDQQPLVKEERCMQHHQHNMGKMLTC